MSSPGPLRLVLDAFRAGCSTESQIAAATSLSDEMVRAAIDHLVRTGDVTAKSLAMGCPSGGCGSCASGDTSGAVSQPGCGAAGPSTSRQGPVLVALTLAPGDPSTDR